jgi:hypothetical protein
VTVKWDIDLIGKAILVIEHKPKFDGVALYKGNNPADFAIAGATDEGGGNVTRLVEASLVVGRINCYEPIYSNVAGMAGNAAV